MAVLKVLPYPNPFLRVRAKDIEVFDDALAQTVRDMEETMADRDGIGLAATQVGLGIRLLLLSPYAFEREEGEGKPNYVVINPEVVWESDEKELGEEGCLSFPGVYITVERPLKVRIRAQDQTGKSYELEGEGLGAEPFYMRSTT